MGARPPDIVRVCAPKTPVGRSTPAFAPYGIGPTRSDRKRGSSAQTVPPASKRQSFAVPGRSAVEYSAFDAQREKQMREILSTEASFVEALASLVGPTQSVLKDRRITTLAAKSGQEGKGAASLRRLCRSVQAMYNLQKRFLADLRSALEGKTVESMARSGDGVCSQDIDGSLVRGTISAKVPPQSATDNNESSVARVFLRYGSYFKLHTEFINAYSDGTAFLISESRAGRPVGVLRGVTPGMGVTSRMVRVIQRVPQYVLFLSQLVRSYQSQWTASIAATSDQGPHPRALCELRRALRLIRSVAAENDAAIAKVDNSRKMTTLQSQMADKSVFVAPHRYRHIQRSQLASILVQTKAGRNVTRPCRLTLFDDILVVACLSPALSVYVGISVIRARIPRSAVELGSDAAPPSIFLRLLLQRRGSLSHAALPPVWIGTTCLQESSAHDNWLKPVWRRDLSTQKTPGMDFFEAIIQGNVHSLPDLLVEAWVCCRGDHDNNNDDDDDDDDDVRKQQQGIIQSSRIPMDAKGLQRVGIARIQLHKMCTDNPAELDKGKLSQSRVHTWYQLCPFHISGTDSGNDSGNDRDHKLTTASKTYSHRASAKDLGSTVRWRGSPQGTHSLGEVKIITDLVYSLGLPASKASSLVTGIARRALKIDSSKSDWGNPVVFKASFETDMVSSDSKIGQQLGPQPKGQPTTPHCGPQAKGQPNSIPIRRYYTYAALCVDENLSLQQLQSEDEMELKITGTNASRIPYFTVHQSRQHDEMSQRLNTTPQHMSQNRPIPHTHDTNSQSKDNESDRDQSRTIASARDDSQAGAVVRHVDARAEYVTFDNPDAIDGKTASTNALQTTVHITKLDQDDVNAWTHTIRGAVRARVEHALRQQLSGAVMSRNAVEVRSFLTLHKLFVDLRLYPGAMRGASKDSGETALAVCAGVGSAELCQMFLNAGASINATDERGRTPLTRAVMARDAETVDMLLRRKADVNARDEDGMRALDHVKSDDENILRLFSTRCRRMRGRPIQGLIK